MKTHSAAPPAEVHNTPFGISPQVFALAIARFSDAFGNSILFVVLPVYFHRFVTGDMPIPAEAAIGILLAIYSFVATVFQPLIGSLADRIGHFKRIIQFGLLLTAIASLGFLFSSTVWELGLWRALQGAGVAMTIPTAMALISRYARRENRATAMAIFVGSRRVGLGIGPVVGGLLIVSVGYDAAFILSAVLILIALFLVQLLVHEPEHNTVGADGRPRQRYRFFDLLGRDGFWTLSLTIVFLAMSLNLLPPLERWINQRLGQDPAAFGLALSIGLFANLLVIVPVGRIADLFGRRRVVYTGLMLLVPATLYLGHAASTLHLYLACALHGAAMALVGAPIYALAGDRAPEGSEGAQMSIMTASFGAGLTLGPLLTGLTAAYVGYTVPFWIAAASLALCLPLLRLTLRGS